jgi:hypothetical protein
MSLLNGICARIFEWDTLQELSSGTGILLDTDKGLELHRPISSLVMTAGMYAPDFSESGGPITGQNYESGPRKRCLPTQNHSSP